MYHDVHRFKELAISDDRASSGQQRTSQTTKIIKAVSKSVRRSSKRSEESMVKDIYKRGLLRTIFKNNLRLFIYKIRKRHYSYLPKSIMDLKEQSLFFEN